MAVLCDWEIRARAEGGQMVVPFNPELLNPASLDVVLGDHLMIETLHQEQHCQNAITKILMALCVPF